MSTELRKVAGKLIKLASLPHQDIKKILKTASKRLVHVLSEISLNAREGVVAVSDKVKNSKIIRLLADKKRKLKDKKKVLCAVGAPIVIKIAITACIEILRALCK